MRLIVEGKYKAEIEKSTSFEVQIKELHDKNKALELDINLMKQEKTLNLEKKKILSAKIEEYESKYPKIR